MWLQEPRVLHGRGEVNSPNDPDLGWLVKGALWFCGWWLVLLFYAVVSIYEAVFPQRDWEYPMGGDV